MQIRVQDSVRSWQSPDGKVTIWEVTLENGTKHNTMSPTIANPGFSGEAELITNDKGKAYLKLPPKEGYTPKAAAGNQYKADPLKQESIEWQCALKASVEAVKDWHNLQIANDKYVTPTLAEYKKQIVDAVVTFTQTIEKKPDTITPSLSTAGDFAKMDMSDATNEEIEGLVNDGPVDLSSIPF